MLEINLLPWREQMRSRKILRMRTFLLITCVLVLCGIVNLYYPRSSPLPTVHIVNPLPKPSGQVDLLLQQLKFAGYLHQDKRSWGLIIFPNGKMHEVHAGSVLDAIHARVLSVSENQIVLLAENQRKFILR